MKKIVAVSFGFLALGVACIPADPCGDYVDYMCECHADDDGFDCEELRDTYAAADADLQDQCTIDLGDQEAEDDATGACAITEDDTAV